MSIMVRVGPGLKPVAGSFFWVSYIGDMTQAFGPSSLLSPDSLAGSWIGRGAAKMKVGVSMGC